MGSQPSKVPILKCPKDFDPKKFKKITLSEFSNKRLFIPKNIWFGFEGLKNKNLLLSLASNSRNHKELMRKKVKDFNYQWK